MDEEVGVETFEAMQLLAIVLLADVMNGVLLGVLALLAVVA